jgi:hypothetical protein
MFEQGLCRNFGQGDGATERMQKILYTILRKVRS